PVGLSSGSAARDFGSRKGRQVHAALHRAIPGGGEIIIFDRSWYNRAGVEYVMGFCTEAQHQRFIRPLRSRNVVTLPLQPSRSSKRSATSAARSPAAVRPGRNHKEINGCDRLRVVPE